MGESNVLSGGIEVLDKIKDSLIDLNDKQSKYDTLVMDESDLDKQIQVLDKAVEDEIVDTTGNRRKEIEATFDKQISKSQDKIKKITVKRDKAKNSKVSERIEQETESYIKENQELKLETKKTLKESGIPAICNSKFFFALYFPKSFSDVFIILISVILAFLLIPCGIYFFLLAEQEIVYLIIIYFITIIVFGGLYILIANRTKEKKREAFLQIKDLRNKVRLNRKKMARIRKKIRKDQDESVYGLEEFDQELAVIEQEVADIRDKKNEALLNFDNNTKVVITNQIQDRFAEKRSQLKKDHEKASSEVAKLDKEIKELTINIASNYEPYIGKDMMTVDRLDSLTNIIKAENATNVSEAILFYNENLNSQ